MAARVSRFLRVLERPITEDECWYIIRQAEKARDKAGSPLLKYASQEKMVAQFLQWDATGQLCIFVDQDDTFIGLLAFDVGTEWWSEERILSELFVFCIDETFKGFGRLAVQHLQTLAKKYQATIIMSGCFFLEKSQIVTNLYKKAGFTLINPVLIKIKEDNK